MALKTLHTRKTLQNAKTIQTLRMHKTPCECTYNVSKEKYAYTIFAVLISFYVNSLLNGFPELMVFTIIVFMNKQEKVCKEKKFLKARPRVA